MRILVADDDSDTRLMISRFLNEWEHDVVTARDGNEAMGILENEPINFVISDWMMPGIDGLELCKRIRSSLLDRYVYVILLTAKNAKDELVTGMDAGADDFIVKPFNKGELKVRIRAGARMLLLQHRLEEKNRSLEAAYSVIKKDLNAAAELQKSFLPNSATSIQGINFEWLFLPCTFVAGDIFNYFELDDRHVGFYLLDVAGHGIPAAMLSVTLSKMLSSPHANSSVVPENEPLLPDRSLLSPARTIAGLNEQFTNEKDAMRYFTMVYGIIDKESKRLTISQAGHPSSIMLRQHTEPSLVEVGGMPVGMLPDATFDEAEIGFDTGDRLLIYSDGITECTNQDKEQFSEDRLLDLLEANKHRPLNQLLQQLRSQLYSWRGNESFPDDVSILAIEKRE